MSVEKKCALCGAVLTRRRARKYCSAACSRRAHTAAKARYAERQKKPLLQLICKNERCGQRFVQSSRKQLYCSPRCRRARVMRLYTRRKRAELRSQRL